MSIPAGGKAADWRGRARGFCGSNSRELSEIVEGEGGGLLKGCVVVEQLLGSGTEVRWSGEGDEGGRRALRRGWGG